MKHTSSHTRRRCTLNLVKYNFSNLQRENCMNSYLTSASRNTHTTLRLQNGHWHTVGRGPWGVGVAQARGAGGGGGRAHAYGFTALPPTTVAPETSSVSAALGRCAGLVPQDRTPEAPAQDRHRHRGARTRVSIRHILYLYREFLLTAFIMWLPKWQVRSLSVRNRKVARKAYISARIRTVECHRQVP